MRLRAGGSYVYFKGTEVLQNARCTVTELPKPAYKTLKQNPWEVRQACRQSKKRAFVANVIRIPSCEFQWLID